MYGFILSLENLPSSFRTCTFDDWKPDIDDSLELKFYVLFINNNI